MNEIRIVDPKTGTLLGKITEEGTEITEAWKAVGKDETKEVEETMENKGDEPSDTTDP